MPYREEYDAMGYDAAAALSKKAYVEKKTVRVVALEEHILPDQEIPRTLGTGCLAVNQNLKEDGECRIRPTRPSSAAVLLQRVEMYGVLHLDVAKVF